MIIIIKNKCIDLNEKTNHLMKVLSAMIMNFSVRSIRNYIIQIVPNKANNLGITEIDITRIIAICAPLRELYKLFVSSICFFMIEASMIDMTSVYRSNDKLRISKVVNVASRIICLVDPTKLSLFSSYILYI